MLLQQLSIALVLGLLAASHGLRFGDVQINLYGRNGKLFNFTQADLDGLTSDASAKAVAALKKKFDSAQAFHNAIGLRTTNVEKSAKSSIKRAQELETKLQKMETLIKSLDTKIGGTEKRIIKTDDVVAGLKNVTLETVMKQFRTDILVKKLKRELDGTKEENSALRSKLTSHQMKIETLKKGMKAGEGERKTMALSLKNAKTQLKKLSKPDQFVAFVATSGKTREVTPSAHVKFDKVILNYGSGYDEASKFVAPRSGYYLLHMTMLARHLQQTKFELIVNGTKYLDIRSGLSYPATSASNSGVVFMSVGETAFVRAFDPAEVFVTSSFSGHFVHE